MRFCLSEKKALRRDLQLEKCWEISDVWQLDVIKNISCSVAVCSQGCVTSWFSYPPPKKIYLFQLSWHCTWLMWNDITGCESVSRTCLNRHNTAFWCHMKCILLRNMWQTPTPYSPYSLGSLLSLFLFPLVLSCSSPINLFCSVCFVSFFFLWNLSPLPLFHAAFT